MESYASDVPFGNHMVKKLFPSQSTGAFLANSKGIASRQLIVSRIFHWKNTLPPLMHEKTRASP
jgi:hypothetical protein